MSRSALLLAVAEECQLPHADERMADLLLDAFDGIFGNRVANATRYRFDKLIKLEAWESAAAMLRGDISWLCPEIISHERRVRLVNGIGRPIEEDAHESRASNTTLALVAAWLKAHARKVRQEEEEEPE
jgi:hypothetical protein